MTSVSASGGRSPVRLCRIVPQTNDPPAWLKAGRAFSFLAALTPRPLRRSIVTVRIPRPSSPLGFRSKGFGASVIVFPVIALQGRQIAFERPCRHPRAPRPELSGEVRNCHLSASNRSSDAINDLLNSSSESIASSSDFIFLFYKAKLHGLTCGFQSLFLSIKTIYMPFLARKSAFPVRRGQRKGRWSRASIDPYPSLVFQLSAASIPQSVNEVSVDPLRGTTPPP